MASFLSRIFGSRNQRLLKQYGKIVRKTNVLQPEFEALSDADLANKTVEFRERLAAGSELDDLIPEAFAAVREAAWRTLQMRHFDVQLIGALALHNNQIAEMRTGEGKTLMATLAVYLNALTGRGVHVVTVNEYLAARDADWMRPVYEFLGLTVGINRSGLMPNEKRDVYAADVTYGTNNEFGFDYLRDNLAFRQEMRSQRDLAFAIVDEVDSILIDEARTPLIISGPSEESPEMYARMNKIVPRLKLQEEPDGPGDYSRDEKSKQIHLTEDGQERAEKLLAEAEMIGPGQSLFDAGNIMMMHFLNACLRAHSLFQRDVDYIVKDGEIVIVDEFTGRTMPGRRWSDGLHQAIEAKEGVPVKNENQTLASITFQNFFRMYDKLSGMTGTADTEAFEFQSIYGLEVIVIPTHKPMVRDDQTDLVYLTKNDKFEAIIEDIGDCRERGQPVLVGTTSIETSEYLAGLLRKRKIAHEVLNAKQHEREAEIVAQAGQPGAVTIATNMAGRGTDIVLGGSLDSELKALGEDAGEEAIAAARTEWKARHEAVLEAGGLHIIGTERHESRRIDNQLRGRAGRQGDPGSSRFYLSMEDGLMRIFGDPERTKRLLSRIGMKEGEVLESKLLTRQIEGAQRKVETHNFDVRKNLLEYDDVANQQRKVIYEQRDGIITSDDMSDAVVGIRAEVLGEVVAEYMPPGSIDEQWDIPALEQALESEFALRCEVQEWLDADNKLRTDGVVEKVIAAADAAFAIKISEVGAELMGQFEKEVMLRQLDSHWKEHLAAMDFLRQHIHLRGYAQKNPKQEYKREALDMFGDMLDRFKRDVTSLLCRVQVREPEDVEAVKARRAEESRVQYRHGEAQTMGQPAAGPARTARNQRNAVVAAAASQGTPFVRDGQKVGRNAPCPCGSGKKYKQCHGKI